MKNTIIVISLLITTACSTVWQNDKGHIRSLSISRNVYAANCDDCKTISVTGEDYQANAVVKTTRTIVRGLVDIAKFMTPRFGASND